MIKGKTCHDAFGKANCRKMTNYLANPQLAIGLG